jgi:hypothetical protein
MGPPNMIGSFCAGLLCDGSFSDGTLLAQITSILEVVCTVRLAIGFLLVLSKWCAQSRLAIGF